MTTGNRARNRTSALAILLIASSALIGCSADASLRDGSETSVEERRDAYDLELAACLRERGFTVEDPEPGQGITDTSPGISEAAAECREEIGAPPASDQTAEDRAAIAATYLAWAECFRDRGYSVADPGPDEAFAIPESASTDDISACTTVPE